MKPAMCTRSTHMIKSPSMFSVTRPLMAEAGQCFRRDWTAPLISTAGGMTIRWGLGTCRASFGWDLTSYTVWLLTTRSDTNCAWIWRITQATKFMLRMITLLCQVEIPIINWALEHTMVKTYCHLLQIHIFIHYSVFYRKGCSCLSIRKGIPLFSASGRVFFEPKPLKRVSDSEMRY